MQRLRGIKQLGSADLVYPGARHTRFEHSIGTLHVAQQMIDAINRAAERSPRDNLAVGAEETRVIRVAALVHDVTHIPFGHHVEDQAGLLHRHDSPQRFEHMLGDGTGLGRTLRELGVARDVLAVLLPEDDGSRVPPYWRQINSDTICSDILDYLARDAYFTGLELGVDPRWSRTSRSNAERQPVHRSRDNLLRDDILGDRAHARGALLLERVLPPRQGRGGCAHRARGRAGAGERLCAKPTSTPRPTTAARLLARAGERTIATRMRARW